MSMTMKAMLTRWSRYGSLVSVRYSGEPRLEPAMANGTRNPQRWGGTSALWRETAHSTRSKFETGDDGSRREPAVGAASLVLCHG